MDGKAAGNRGKGRPRGAKNKVTKALKDAILGALDDAGGQDYLARMADEEPSAFLGLLGRVLPTTLAGDAKNPVRHIFEWATTEPKSGGS